MNKKFMGIILFCGIILFTTFMSLGKVYENQRAYKNELIRFHVIANSDSPKDQALKLKVRDEVIKKLNPKFEKSKSLDESRDIIKKNIDIIEEVAGEVIASNGYNYEVKASLGEVNFPTKNYGSITLPAGEYEALRVVIGDGDGANWWCVLFPPLCFIDMENGLTDERTKEEMKSVLTKEEFNMIYTKKNQELPLKLKFKIVEVIESAKEKINNKLVMK
ncbi:MAG: stage II sporulation protein R [Anaeromicrobium sp.]|jgi:stage II sporulation protein R|uniref:stage II sporulation protein R n=1 Tax=Anaeromicrobium sp. TaxID=1929132 RepID=UPI0025DC2720|nr:stage II sporulation protein R [Anaeromicrobium sp.]MCT4593726.1 stage II sporulation protein R [Anaeromicrobium sp.]